MKMLCKIEHMLRRRPTPFDIHVGGVRARPAQELEAFPSVIFIRASPTVLWIGKPKCLSLAVFGGNLTNKSETGTAYTSGTTNSKLPGPIIVIDQSL